MLCLLIINSIHLQAKTYSDTIDNFIVVKVRDGDEIAVRIRGIDTPELKDEREEIRKISIQAKEELEKLLLNAKKITLYNLGRDKYFRLLASVKADNVDIAEYMINKGLAKKYDGGKKVW